MTNIRTDHVAGGFFIVVGIVIFALSGDLPFGSMASPGSGMMPMLITAMMMAFGAVLMVRAKESEPLAAIDWDDFKHAARVVVIIAIATAVYLTLGFVITMTALMLALLVIAERRPVLHAIAFSVGITLLTYFLFTYPLKTPLEQGILGF